MDKEISKDAEAFIQRVEDTRKLLDYPQRANTALGDMENCVNDCLELLAKCSGFGLDKIARLAQSLGTGRWRPQG